MTLTARTKDMTQDATYWAPGANDGFGNVNFTASPVAIKCRWETRGVLFRNADGEEKTSEAVVYVDRELSVKGYVALGDHTGESDPTGVDGAREIRAAHQSPDIQGKNVLHKVML